MNAVYLYLHFHCIVSFSQQFYLTKSNSWTPLFLKIPFFSDSGIAFWLKCQSIGSSRQAIYKLQVTQNQGFLSGSPVGSVCNRGAKVSKQCKINTPPAPCNNVALWHVFLVRLRHGCYGTAGTTTPVAKHSFVNMDNKISLFYLKIPSGRKNVHFWNLVFLISLSDF